jgi:hypothetical protein
LRRALRQAILDDEVATFDEPQLAQFPCWNPPMNDAGGAPTRKKAMRLMFPASCAGAATGPAATEQANET